jgi:hypothetical protein
MSILNKVIKISRKEININIHKNICPCKVGMYKNEKNAERTNNLSARGSRKTPTFEIILYFLAILPSKASVIDAITNTQSAISLLCVTPEKRK